MVWGLGLLDGTDQLHSYDSRTSLHWAGAGGSIGGVAQSAIWSRPIGLMGHFAESLKAIALVDLPAFPGLPQPSSLFLTARLTRTSLSTSPVLLLFYKNQENENADELLVRDDQPPADDLPGRTTGVLSFSLLMKGELGQTSILF